MSALGQNATTEPVLTGGPQSGAMFYQQDTAQEPGNSRIQGEASFFPSMQPNTAEFSSAHFQSHVNQSLSLGQSQVNHLPQNSYPETGVGLIQRQEQPPPPRVQTSSVHTCGTNLDLQEGRQHLQGGFLYPVRGGFACIYHISIGCLTCEVSSG